MIGRFNFFSKISLRHSLQHLSSLSIFPLQELVVSDEFSEIKVEVLTRKTLFKLSIKLLAKICFLTSSKCRLHRKRDLM